MCPLDIPRVMYNRANHEYVAERKKEEMTTAEVLTLVDDVAAMGVKRITLTGGEAFLRTDIFEILARIKERGLRVCVNTNGWFLGKAQAKRIVEMGVDEMSISVDGPNETHDFIRRREGSFKHILDSLTNLQEAREELGRENPGVGITCTISALNQSNFSEVLDALKDYKVITSIEFEYMFFTERWAEKATEKLSLPV